MGQEQKAEVLIFPTPHFEAKSLKEMVGMVQNIARDSSRVFIRNKHVKENTVKRNVTSKQIFDVLQYGKGIDGPTLDLKGDWRIKMRKYSAGRTVQVVVAVRENQLEVITVI